MRKIKIDEKKWKPIIVGIVVFIIVFIGLTIYQQTSEKAQGDVVIINDKIDTVDEEIPVDIVVITEPSVIFIDVDGAVNLSGIFALPAGSRVADAIVAAGGLAENADVRYINRAYVLSDGDKLYIPTVSEVADGTAPPSAGHVTESAGAVGTASQGSTGTSLININTASSEELQKLNGVGPAIAQRIIDHRTNKGMFNRIEDLMNVSGIGAKTFEKLRDHITV